VLNHMADGASDGVLMGDRCLGSYIHGILDNSVVIDHLLSPYMDKLSQKTFDYRAFKEEQYNLLADHVRRYVDMEKIYRILENRS
jgi:adenosylcobyric acid synthase